MPTSLPGTAIVSPPHGGERTGWRDAEISRRHRRWGFSCMATDLDFVLVEHHVGLPVAVIEYKHFRAHPVSLDQPSYLALAVLAGPLPFLVARYWPDTWAFRLLPGNQAARRWFPDVTDLSEAEWVTVMHDMRAKTVQEAVGRNLGTHRPPAAA